MEKELQEALQAALGRLPEKQRMALVLRQYEQLDYEEIAAALQTSVPSVKSLLFRARETLREALQVYLGAT
jgi:RNA polymerase sigma-70 factor (ECF subfamily)